MKELIICKYCGKPVIAPRGYDFHFSCQAISIYDKFDWPFTCVKGELDEPSLLEKALLLAKKKQQIIGRENDYYVTLEQLNELIKK